MLLNFSPRKSHTVTYYHLKVKSTETGGSLFVYVFIDCFLLSRILYLLNKLFFVLFFLSLHVPVYIIEYNHFYEYDYWSIPKL